GGEVARGAGAMGELGKVERIAQGGGPGSGGRDGREIENRKRDHHARPSLCIAGQMVLVRSATWEEAARRSSWHYWVPALTKGPPTAELTLLATSRAARGRTTYLTAACCWSADGPWASLWP